ncbi:TetR/AcrR family transcriptional regulator [Actinoplanes sp. NPDC051411]|uniref:TetR/AcrR family transcriptional regulator n=1 Tax=Actinoplanes sp. NPDC051411 TaxID=3155522 RepID=UPI0034157ACB
MGRVSQAQAQENRRTVVRTAGRLFRERGIDGVSVADIMAEAGLTHGGFYKQFESKEALVVEAVAEAFAEQAETLRHYRDQPDRAAALAAFFGSYLSPGHRDDPGPGCPTAGFGGDLAREEHETPAREVYAKGIDRYSRWLGSETEPDLVTVSTMVGAVILARATAGLEISDRILEAARQALTPGRRDSAAAE